MYVLAFSIFCLSFATVLSKPNVVKLNSIHLNVMPNAYNVSKSFVLECTVNIEPKTVEYVVSFFQNKTLIGSYTMRGIYTFFVLLTMHSNMIILGNELYLWNSKQPYFKQGSSNYPTFKATVMPDKFKTSGSYYCVLGYFESYTTIDGSWASSSTITSNTWNTSGVLKPLTKPSFFVIFALFIIKTILKY